MSRLRSSASPVGVFILMSAQVALGRQSLVGSQADLEAYYPSLSFAYGLNLVAVVMDPEPPTGIEFPWVLTGSPSGVPVWSADVDAATITLNHHEMVNNLGSAPFNGFVFTFAGLTQPIANVTLDPASTLIPASFWATGDAVFMNYQGLGNIGPGIKTVLHVTFVPTPGSVPLLVAAGLAFLRRRPVPTRA